MNDSNTLLDRAAQWQLRRRKLGKRAMTAGIVAVGTTLAVTASVGIAYAAWTTTSTGGGTAKAATFTPPTVVAGTVAPTTLLYPGLTADGSTVGGDLTLKVSNTNPFSVTVTGVAPGTGNVTSDAGAACVDGGANPTGVSVLTKSSSLSGTNLTIPANTPSGVNVTINKVVSMSTASATGCQGATFTIPNTGVILTFSS